MSIYAQSNVCNVATKSALRPFDQRARKLIFRVIAPHEPQHLTLRLFVKSMHWSQSMRQLNEFWFFFLLALSLPVSSIRFSLLSLSLSDCVPISLISSHLSLFPCMIILSVLFVVLFSSFHSPMSCNWCKFNMNYETFHSVSNQADF